MAARTCTASPKATPAQAAIPFSSGEGTTRSPTSYPKDAPQHLSVSKLTQISGEIIFV